MPLLRMNAIRRKMDGRSVRSFFVAMALFPVSVSSLTGDKTAP